MRVVVTGGAGRIGRSTVADLVEHGHEVTVLDLAPPAVPFPKGVTLRLGSVDECGSVMAVLRNARADAVVHLARASTNHDDLTVFRSNVMGAFHILQGAAACGQGVALVASSIQALGDYWNLRQVPKYLPLDEDHPVAPRSAYATSKAVTEETCRAVSREHGLTTVAIRPTAVIVPQRWPELLDRLRAARPGDSPLVDGPLAAYVDARDVAQLIRRALDGALAGALGGAHLFHASGADPLLTGTLAESIAKRHPECAAVATRLESGQPGVSIERARRLLGYEPRYRWADMLQNSSP
ncbi:MAG: NAD(P)-dependent oxidoreductase [Chloroflexota bacterium]|nr:NAD(P)-dependent oxidoreductase [Chloroflexota bacterium]